MSKATGGKLHSSHRFSKKKGSLLGVKAARGKLHCSERLLKKRGNSFDPYTYVLEG